MLGCFNKKNADVDYAVKWWTMTLTCPPADSSSVIPMENVSPADSISVIPMENSRLQFGDSDGKCQSSVFQTQTWAEGIKRRETGLSVDIHQNHHHPSGKSEDKTSAV